MDLLGLALSFIVAIVILRRLSGLEFAQFPLLSRLILIMAQAAGIAFVFAALAAMAAIIVAPRLDLAAANFLLITQMTGPVVFIISLVTIFCLKMRTRS